MAAAVLSSAAKRPPLRFPELVVRWRGVRASEADVEDVCRLAEQPRSRTLPFLYFQVIGFRLHMALLTHPAFPLPIWRMMQVRNRLRQERPLARTASVDFELRLQDHRILAKGAEVDVYMSVSESGAPAWESLNTFYARGAFGVATSAAAESMPAPGGPELARWTASTEGALRFASLTGDYNGLHLSDFYSRRLGFAQAFLHPQRVLGACLARMLGDRAPSRLEAWLKGPVPYGAGVHLRAEERGGETRFGLWSETDPRPALLGRLEAK